jgi:hypothetical protein
VKRFLHAVEPTVAFHSDDPVSDHEVMSLAIVRGTGRVYRARTDRFWRLVSSIEGVTTSMRNENARDLGKSELNQEEDPT